MDRDPCPNHSMAFLLGPVPFPSSLPSVSHPFLFMILDESNGQLSPFRLKSVSLEHPTWGHLCPWHLAPPATDIFPTASKPLSLADAPWEDHLWTAWAPCHCTLPGAAAFTQGPGLLLQASRLPESALEGAAQSRAPRSPQGGEKAGARQAKLASLTFVERGRS